MTTTLPFSTWSPGEVFGEIGRGQPVNEYVDDCIEAGLVHTIHVSERRSFRSCRQRWDWVYNEDLHTSESIRALEFGQAYHHAMEKFYDPATWHLDKRVLAEHAIAEFKRFTLDTFEKFRRQARTDPALIEDFNDRLISGEAMLRHYFDSVAPITDTFEPIEVEIAFEVPLLDPDGNYLLCKCDRCQERYAATQADNWDPSIEELQAWPGLPVTIGGRLDALIRDLETGELGVLDWKTAANLMPDQDLDFLDLDDQISTYLLAMHKLGVAARFFVYHEQRKASPVPPEPYAGTRTIKGRRYQASKSLPTTYEIYKETVEEGDPYGYTTGAYDEFLDWLKNEGPKFHQRTVVRRNNDQLRATERHIYFEFLDMVSGHVYPNPTKMQCTWCKFFDPCLGKQRGEPYQHTLNTVYVKGGPRLNDGNLPKQAK